MDNFFGGWVGFLSVVRHNGYMTDEAEIQNCDNFSCHKCPACDSYDAYLNGELADK